MDRVRWSRRNQVGPGPEIDQVGERQRNPVVSPHGQDFRRKGRSRGPSRQVDGFTTSNNAARSLFEGTPAVPPVKSVAPARQPVEGRIAGPDVFHDQPARGERSQHVENLLRGIWSVTMRRWMPPISKAQSKKPSARSRKPALSSHRQPAAGVGRAKSTTRGRMSAFFAEAARQSAETASGSSSMAMTDAPFSRGNQAEFAAAGANIEHSRRFESVSAFSTNVFAAASSSPERGWPRFQRPAPAHPVSCEAREAVRKDKSGFAGVAGPTLPIQAVVFETASTRGKVTNPDPAGTSAASREGGKQHLSASAVAMEQEQFAAWVTDRCG